jgi:hypothetical protein
MRPFGTSVPIAPPGQEGWREAPGWLFQIEEFCLSNVIHHPVCGFAAATPPGQEGRSTHFSFVSSINEDHQRRIRRTGNHRDQ